MSLDKVSTRIWVDDDETCDFSDLPKIGCAHCKGLDKVKVDILEPWGGTHPTEGFAKYGAGVMYQDEQAFLRRQRDEAEFARRTLDLQFGTGTRAGALPDVGDPEE